MISDEAVEAAARAHDAEDAAQRGEPDPWDLEGDDFNEFRADRMSAMRAALEAALPHLIASQGCGTGHSGEQLEPAVGATAALAKKTMTLNLTDEEIAALEEIAKARDATPRTIFRSALKVFQLEARGLATINIDLGPLSAPDQEAVKQYDKMVREVNRMRDDGTIPDGGEAVHSPDEREGSRDEPKNDLAHPQKGGEG